MSIPQSTVKMYYHLNNSNVTKLILKIGGGRAQNQSKCKLSFIITSANLLENFASFLEVQGLSCQRT